MDRQDLQTVKSLKKVHNDAFDAVGAKIAELTDKYATATGSTPSEVDRWLKDYTVGDAERAKIQEYVKNKDFSPEANKFLKQYNFATKASGLKLLQNNIGVELAKLGDRSEKVIKASLTKAQVEELTTNKGVMAELHGSGKPVESTINASYQGATWSSRIWNQMDELRDTIDTEMKKALTLGNGYPMKNVIKKKFGVSSNDAKRLALTEMTRVRMDARLSRFKDNGVDSYKYNAIIDSRTSDICTGLNGMVFKLEDAEAGVNLPPMHPYCRSSVLPVRGILDEGMDESPEQSLAFAEEMLKNNPDSQLWQGAVAYQKGRQEFNPGDYKDIDDDYVKNYAGKYLEHINSTPELKDAYKSYVGSATSFDINKLLYSGKYQTYLDTGNISKGAAKFVDTIKPLLNMIKNAPPLQDNTRLIRYADSNSVYGLLKQIDHGFNKSQVEYTKTLHEATPQDLVNGRNEKWVSIFGKLVKSTTVYSELVANGNDREQKVVSAGKLVDKFNAQFKGAKVETESFFSTSYDTSKNIFTTRPVKIEIYADKGTPALYTDNYRESEVVIPPGATLELLEMTVNEQTMVLPKSKEGQYTFPQLSEEIVLKVRIKK